MKTLFFALSLLMLGTVSQDAEAARCRAELLTRNGNLIQSFRGQGWDRQEACRMARRQCRQELRYRQNMGRNPYAYCSVGLGGGGHQQIVQRWCQSYLIGRAGRIRRTFQAQAQGPRGTGVKRMACNKARRKCNRFRNETGRYQAQCRTEQNLGPIY